MHLYQLFKNRFRVLSFLTADVVKADHSDRSRCAERSMGLFTSWCWCVWSVNRGDGSHGLSWTGSLTPCSFNERRWCLTHLRGCVCVCLTLLSSPTLQNWTNSVIVQWFELYKFVLLSSWSSFLMFSYTCYWKYVKKHTIKICLLLLEEGAFIFLRSWFSTLSI